MLRTSASKSLPIPDPFKSECVHRLVTSTILVELESLSERKIARLLNSSIGFA